MVIFTYTRLVLDYLVVWFINGTSKGMVTSNTIEIGNLSMQKYVRLPAGGNIGETQWGKESQTCNLSLCWREINHFRGNQWRNSSKNLDRSFLCLNYDKRFRKYTFKDLPSA